MWKFLVLSIIYNQFATEDWGRSNNRNGREKGKWMGNFYVCLSF